MLSVEFAPNEHWDDAWLSLATIFQPWRWEKGPEIDKVRSQIANMVSHEPEDVFFYLSGRAGLYHLIKNLALPAGSEIIVTGFTCEAVVLPIIANNCTPIYSDISDLDYSIDPSKTPPLISKKAKCLLIQHTFGIPPRRDTLIALAKKHDLIVIEDLAHGFQKNIFKNDDVQTIKLLSFGRSKSMSSVFGGAVITGERSLQKKLVADNDNLRRLTNGNLVKLLLYKPLACLVKSTYSFLHLGKLLHKVFVKTGLLVPEISKKEKRGEYDSYLDLRLPNALAILLSHQLAKYEQTYENRQRVVSIYRQALKGKLQDDFSLARYPVLVRDREKVLAECRKYGLYLGKWYTQVVAPAEVDLKKMGYTKGDCPVAENVCNHIVNLPTFVSEEQARDITEIVRKYVIEG